MVSNKTPMCIVSVLANLENIRSDTGGNVHRASSDMSGFTISLQHKVDSCHKISSAWQVLNSIFFIFIFHFDIGMQEWSSIPVLTLKVLNFWTCIETWSGWILDSYWSLKPLCSGMGEVVPARTSPTLPPPSPRTVLSLSCFKVSQCINCRD